LAKPLSYNEAEKEAAAGAEVTVADAKVVGVATGATAERTLEPAKAPAFRPQDPVPATTVKGKK
jgi:ribose 5-phosphate isomerase